MNRYAFIVTCNQKYLYALNATMNAMEVAGVKADFEVVYNEVDPEYIEKSKTAFDFDVKWTHIKTYPVPKDYFSQKYHHALAVKDKYDAVCIIDADLFMYTDVSEYFRLAAEEEMFVTANNVRWLKEFPFGNPDDPSIDWNKPWWIYADFPTFFNPRVYEQFVKDWIAFGEYSSRLPHMAPNSASPCGSMNRSICKNVDPKKIIKLDGWVWVADFQTSANEVGNTGDRLTYLNDANPQWNRNLLGKQINAIHNRWWQPNRAEMDLRGAPSNTVLERSMKSTLNFMQPFCKRKLYKYITCCRTTEIAPPPKG